MTDIETKLAELEARIDALEGRHRADDLAQGSVEYRGRVDFAGEIDWTIHYSAAAVLELPASARVDVLAALGHPIRLALVQLLLDGPRAGAELADAVDLTSTGQLYHHLRALSSAGIIEQHGRGNYHIPAPKVVPVLVLMTAAADIAGILRH